MFLLTEPILLFVGDLEQRTLLHVRFHQTIYIEKQDRSPYIAASLLPSFMHDIVIIGRSNVSAGRNITQVDRFITQPRDIPAMVG